MMLKEPMEISPPLPSCLRAACLCLQRGLRKVVEGTLEGGLVLRLRRAGGQSDRLAGSHQLPHDHVDMMST